MIILQQSASLRETFKNQVDRKISDKRQATKESLGSGLLGSLGTFAFDINQFSNQFKGS